jgi:hypothetical protein
MIFKRRMQVHVQAGVEKHGGQAFTQAHVQADVENLGCKRSRWRCASVRRLSEPKRVRRMIRTSRCGQ